MDSGLKKILRAISLELRHVLEGRYDDQGRWLAGDLERRLNELGVWRDRPAKAFAELSHLSAEDKVARHIVDAYLRLRDEAGVARNEAVAEFVREAAYTWANRLFALRCMEARSIIDEVILQKESYGGRSLVHSRLARRNPEACAGEDDGLFAVLFTEFTERATDLPVLFNPYVPAVALRPSVTALKKCIALLSGREAVRGQEPASDAVFEAPDAFGWAYQYWNVEEKERVFEMVRTKKGAKIEGADIIPATCIYTEPYMVKFLVQNSLGALWMGMHPESSLCQGWEYYVKDADRVPVEKKLVAAITFLDPACGSGHFLLEAFDLLFSMYEGEGEVKEPSEICAAILNSNLFGIDIDERAVQIAEAALWMKAKEKAPDLDPTALQSFRDHLVATNIRLPKGKDHLQAFLKKHPEDQPLRSALEAVFQGLENAHELGSLLRIEEPVEKELRYLKAKSEENKGKLEQQALFAEVAQPRQGELPLGVESYEQWKAHALARLRVHFGAEAEAADPVQAFFGQSAEKGLALFDLLSRRYDIVAANPPYMGSKNMGTVLKNHIGGYFVIGKRDLYAAFIFRCHQFCNPSAQLAMVTLHSWMFLSSFNELRKFVLERDRVKLIVQLGRHAFSEADPPGNAVLFVLSIDDIAPDNRIIAFRLSSPRLADEQAKLLLSLISEDKKEAPKYYMAQTDIVRIQNSPFVFWLSPGLLDFLSSNKTQLGSQFDVRQGLATTDNPRFVRENGEILDQADRWISYVKGGGYRKWVGFEILLVDWQYDGERVKNVVLKDPSTSHWSRRVASREYYFRPGSTYSLVARHGFSIRLLRSGSIFDVSGTSLFARDSRADTSLAEAVLNTRLYTFLLRVITQTLTFHAGYVSSVPFPENLPTSKLETLVSYARQLKEFICAQDIRERVFSPHLRFSNGLGDLVNLAAASLLAIEFTIEEIIASACGFGEEDTKAVFAETGSPAGAYTKIGCYPENLPQLTDNIPVPCVISPSSQSERTSFPSKDELAQIKSQLRALYESGPGLEVEETDNALLAEDDNVEGEEIGEDLVTTRIHIPSETFLEELCHRVQIHPVTIYWIVKEGCEKEGWRCLPEEKRLEEDRFSVLVLRLLGHRWPKQIEVGEQLPDWADRDGIIPITEGSGEKALLERVRERIAEEFPSGNVAGIEREFEEIIGTRLEKWLAGPFFKRHISQFKKRPIAWQIELWTRGQGLGARGRRKAASYNSGPVFSCLVYYHKLDVDLLPKIRSQYVGPLKSGYETELRALERIENPTTDQSARKVQLTNWIDELKVLDEKLSEVIVSGFGPESLQSQLRQFAIDDALLALKARWLQKLIGVVQEGPLESWKQAAIDTELHPEFPEWIQDALTHLDHYCSAVGPKAPEEKTLGQDPDSAYLAALICQETEAMVSGALACACQKWGKQFDKAVIAPIRQQVAELNEKIKLRKEERELVDSQTTPYQRADIEREIEDLKEQVSALKDEQAQKVATGQHGRAQIEGWICPEAERWEPWLATQPLYDEISRLDGRRFPPHTVAEFIAQESVYAPDINDGVRVNIAPLQRAGLLPAEVIAKKDLEKAIADRAEWRADERRWCREGKLPYPGWWKKKQEEVPLTLEAAT